MTVKTALIGGIFMFDITPYEMRSMYRNPFREMEKLEKEFFGRGGANDFCTDIKDNGDSYLLEADLPGFKKEDIHVDIQNGYLTISAERHSEDEKKDSKGNVIHSERSFGSFSRSFNLSGIDEDKITASYKDGVLALTMPKANQTVPETRRLEIQ